MMRRPDSPAPWLFALTALLTASFLLAYYVNLLQQSVERGHQARYSQQAAPVVPLKPSRTVDRSAS